jgi:hypothetical protein
MRKQLAVSLPFLARSNWQLRITCTYKQLAAISALAAIGGDGANRSLLALIKDPTADAGDQRALAEVRATAELRSWLLLSLI